MVCHSIEFIYFNPSSFPNREIVEARALPYPCNWCFHWRQSLPRASFCCHCNELQGLLPLACNSFVDGKLQPLSVMATNFSRSKYCCALSCFPNSPPSQRKYQRKICPFKTVRDFYCGKGKKKLCPFSLWKATYNNPNILLNYLKPLLTPQCFIN